MLRKTALLLALLVALALGVLAVGPPDPEPGGPQSRALLQPGPYPVGEAEVSLEDPSRETPGNGDFPGAPTRRFEGALWYPAGPPGRRFSDLGSPPPVDRSGAPYPLVVYSHGFMSWHAEGRYLARHLAGHGYAVLAVSYPLTNFWSPGGPQFEDVANQPDDVRFLIDSALAWSDDPGHRFAGLIDGRRIAAAGLSLGGLTTALAAYHPRLRDPRIRAAVSIAGPTSLFTRRFFKTADVPFLMIAGDIDAIVDYGANVETLPRRAPHAVVVTLAGASHAGFADVARRLLRWSHNPDAVGCSRLDVRLPEEPEPRPFFSAFGGEAEGILAEPDAPMPCRDPDLPRALRPARQHMLTTLAALAFLEGEFSPDVSTRRARADFLRRGLPDENDEVEVTAPASG